MKLIGIDIGGTKCAVIAGDENGNIIKRVSFPTENKNISVNRILSEIEKLEAEYHSDAIGISCGGPLDSKKGIIMSPPNLPGWDEVPICGMLFEKFHLPCGIMNDADACALAEWRTGAGVGTKNMVFLTFGTGLGAGLILNGKPYSGTCGNAGEVGHIRLAANGPVGYHKAGSFEGFCSGGGIRRLGITEAKKLLKNGNGPSYCVTPDMLDSISAKTIAQEAYRGDKTAIGIYKKCGKYLGRGIAIIIDMLNPEAIVIGGIYPRAKELLEPELMKWLEKESITDSRKVCRILQAKHGEQIGDKGALAVAAMQL